MTGAANPRLTRGVWWAVAIFFLASIVSVLDRQILTLMVDPVRRDLNITDVQISLLQGPSFSIFYTVMGLPLGLMADRTSRRWLMIGGISAWSLATILGGLATSFEGILLTRICVGIGEATLSPAAISMISDMAPAQGRGRLIGIFLMGQSVGGGLSALLVGSILGAGPSGVFSVLPMLDALAPWRQAFIVAGLLGYAVVLLMLTVREPVRQRIDNAAPSGSLRSVIGYFGMRANLMLPIYLGFAMMGVAYYGVGAWGPTMIIRHFGLTAAETSHLFGPASIAGSLIGSFIGGALANKVAPADDAAAKLRLLSFLSLAFLPAAIAVFAPSATAAITLIVLSNMCFSICGVVLITLVQNLVPNNMSGVASSLISFFTTLIGFTLGPLLIALATEHVYRDPLLVGYSMTTVIIPAIIFAALLFRRGYYAARRGDGAGTIT